MTNDPVILLMLAAIFMLVWWVVKLVIVNRKLRRDVDLLSEGWMDEYQ